jgi:peptidoglycan/xylan/chitin deacetylase (PgdA/CDA1 family)
LLVIGWHNVSPTPYFPSAPGAGISGLSRQLSLIRRFCNIVPLASALSDLAGGRRLPPRAVALSFDDGYRDNLELVLPLLERMGVPATFFLTPGVLDRSVEPWWEVLGWSFAHATRRQVSWHGHELAAGADACFPPAMVEAVVGTLTQMPRAERDAAIEELIDGLEPQGEHRVADLFLDWDGARQLASRAAVGSHTMYHAILAREDPADQRQDLEESRRQLEKQLGTRVTLLAYPNGTARDFDGNTVEAARSAGFDAALTTIPGWNVSDTPAFSIRRFVINPLQGRNGLRDLVGEPGFMTFVFDR